MIEERKESLEGIDNISIPGKRSLRNDSWLVSKDLLSSFKHAFQGLFYALLSQRNFRIHVCIGLVVSALAIWLDLSFYEIAILIITVGAVLVLELLNTSIEAVVDLAIGRRFHPLARIAKDSAAGAVLVASLCSLLIAGLLIVPPFITRLGI